MKVLVVEDNMELLKDVRNFLSEEGNICELATNYKTAQEKIGFFPYDILIMDLNLPDGDGLDIVKSVKMDKIDVGIIIISARNALGDKVEALELGADDYLEKPFYLSELNARAKALYRRRAYHGRKEINFNEISIRPESREVFVNNTLLNLTKKEYDIIHFFLINKHRLLTKEAIAEHLWGDEVEMTDGYKFIYTHLANLRKKIAAQNGEDYIQSIYNVGYKFSNRA